MKIKTTTKTKLLCSTVQFFFCIQTEKNKPPVAVKINFYTKKNSNIATISTLYANIVVGGGQKK